MSEVHGLGAHGIYPFMGDSDELRKFNKIKTKAGRMAYVTTLGKKSKSPTAQDGIDEARGALKWIKEEIDEI